MNEIVTLLLPFFALVLIGYGAGYFRFVGEAGLAGLNFFVLYLALPAFFFQLVAATPITAFAGWSFIATTTFATYCAFAIAFSIGALTNGGNVPQATIEGLVGSYGNVGYVAPALTVAAFGTTAAMPTALIFTFDNAMVFTMAPLMMALGGIARTRPEKLAEEIGVQVLLHPFVIATALGFLAAASGWRMPSGIDALLLMLRHAAPPLALFVFGVGLALRPVGNVPVELPILIGVKLIAHPLIVYLLLSWVGGFDPIWVNAAVLMAALPPAANVLALAHRYNIYAERASTAVLLGAVISVATLTLILIVLLNGFLPLDPFR